MTDTPTELETHEAVEFLRGFDPNGWHNIVAMDALEKRLVTGRTFEPGDYDGMFRFVDQWNGKRNLYFSPNEPRPGAPHAKLSKADIAAARAVHADFDPDAGADLAKARLDAIARLAEADPSIVLDSGGGIQAFWKFAEKIPLDDPQWLEALNAAVRERFGGDPAVKNVDRVMRLPYTLNIPTDTKLKKHPDRRPRLAAVISANGPTCDRPTLESRFPPVQTSRPTPKSEQPLVELDTPSALRLAKEYLIERAPEAIEGAGGDQTTFAVACGLRDYAVSEPMALELMLDHWNEQKASPPWAPDELAEKVSNAYQYASGGFGNKRADAEMPPIDLGEGEPEAEAPSEAKPAEKKQRTFRALSFKEAAEQAIARNAEPLIEDILDRGSCSVIFGPSNSGKTFVALDMAAAIATGRPWNDRDVEQGAVLYIAAEGGGAITKRFAALKRQRHVPDITPLMLAPFSVDLFSNDHDARRIIKESKRLEQELAAPLRLIVIDTLARTMGGGDENSGQDMGAYVRHLDMIREQTKAAVLVVHHTGKDQARGMRGHSSLMAALDTAIQVERGERTKPGLLKCSKQRDMEPFDDIRFMLERVPIGQDKKGKDLASCVVRWVDQSEFDAVPLTTASEAYLEALRTIEQPASLEAWDAAYRRAVDPNWREGSEVPNGCSTVNLRRRRQEIIEAGHVEKLPTGLFRTRAWAAANENDASPRSLSA